MSTEAERALVQRLAAGELDPAETERARALLEQDPELAQLYRALADLGALTREAFPEPPPLGDTRAFVTMLEELTPLRVDAWREPLSEMRRVRAAQYDQLRALESPPEEAPPRTTGRVWEEIEQPAPSPRALRTVRARLGRLSSRAAPPPEAHLFHLREIPREDGLAVELELHAGDILALHSEVLLLSAFAGSYAPVPGSIFGALTERFGISFPSGPPPGAVRHPGGLVHFRGVSCEAFDSLWVADMRDLREPFTLADLRRTLDAVRRCLPLMLEGGASSLTLPLLGTGQQQLDPRDVVREILSALPRWAESPRLRSVRLVTLELSNVALLNRALDDRNLPHADSALRSACLELERRLDRGSASEPVRAALKNLLQIALAPYPSLPSLALEGRRVAEAVLHELARRGRAATPSPEDDAQEAEAAARLSSPDALRADLVTRQLELLLAYARQAAAGGPVAMHDAVMVVYAAIGAAEGLRDEVR